MKTPATTEDSRPLILTAEMDPASAAKYTDLRQRHFPRERNFLAAHITMFHALPGHSYDDILSKISDLCAETVPIPAIVSGVRFLGNGTAFDVDCPNLIKMRGAMAAAWQQFLTPQDRQAFRPHITIQNKVEAQKARKFYEETKAAFTQDNLTVTGIGIWRYDGGPWAHAAFFDFKVAQP